MKSEVKKSNLTKMENSLKILKKKYENCTVDYDTIYNKFEGWMGYAKNANIYKLREKLGSKLEFLFPNEISPKEMSRLNYSKSL